MGKKQNSSSKTLSSKEIVLEYLQKYHNNYPKATIAKIIYKDYPHAFKNIENVRTLVRYYTGANGKNHRKSLSNSEFVKPLTYKFDAFSDIPKSFRNEPSFFTLPTGIKKILILSDIHFPYHDEDALRIAVMKGVSENVDCVLLNGDILDFYQLSDFSKDPSKPKMKTELEQGRWFMKALRETFPKAPIYYKIGNHEARLERWLRLKAPEWLDTEEFQINVLLKFGEHKIQLIDSHTIIQAGSLTILHGHEYKGAGTVNPARNLYLKTKVSAICGHYHRKSEFLTKNVNEIISGCWTTGCLCELNPEYMPKGNDWVHGFAIVEMLKEGNFKVNNYCIIDNQIV